MLQLVAEQHVDRPVDEVFAFVGHDYFEHQPIWDPAFIEMRPITPPPIGVGSRANFVRQERRGEMSGIAEVLGYEQGRYISVINRFARGDQTRTISCHQLSSGGTRLRVVIENEVRGVAWLVAVLFQGILQRALKVSLTAIKSAIEENVC